jgi:hypothetical protein
MAIAGADVPASQLSVFFDALEELRVCSTDAAAAIASDGGTGSSPPAWEPMWSDSVKMKALLPGSILIMVSGAVAKVPVDRALISSASSLSLSVIEEVDGTAHARSESWCATNIKSVIPGILTDVAKSGPLGGNLSMNGIPVTFSLGPNPDGSDDKQFSHITISGTGLVPKALAMAEVPRLGASFALRPWAGGIRQPSLHQGGGLPDITTLATATVVVDHLVGGDGVTIVRKAMLQLTALISSTSVVDIPSDELATFVAGAVGLEDRQQALQLVLISSLAAIGSAPSPAALRVAKLRQVIFETVRKVLDSLSPPIVVILQARLVAMGAGGFSLSPGGGGSVIRYMRDELYAQERARALGLAAALAAAPTPAPAAVPPDPPPITAALPAAAIPPAAAPALVGMAALRPPPVLPATVPHTDLDVFVGLGGEPVVRRIAVLCGFRDPLIFMTGHGSVASAEEAAENFTSLLGSARASAPADPRLFRTTAPSDFDEAGSTLRVVMRTVELASRGIPSPASGPTPSGAAQSTPLAAATGKRDSSLSKELKTVPASAATERIMRACSASFINPLCADAEVRRAALHKPLDDPVAEARRNIDLHGARAVGFLLSSGEVNGDTVGEAPSPLVAARSGLVALVALQGELMATPSRAREAAPTILLISQSTVACDVKSTPVIMLFGGLPPSLNVWRTDRDLQPAILGRWGTVTGALALGDAERAMRMFAPILVTILCTVGGAPPPSEPTLGLVPLIQATACLDDATRISLLDECFERIFQQHRLRLSNPLAPPADPEAVFFDAAANAVKPLADQAASQRAGTQAGREAAQAFLATTTGTSLKRGLATTQPVPGQLAPTLSPLSKKERKAAKAAAAAPTGLVNPAASTPPSLGSATAAVAAPAGLLLQAPIPPAPAPGGPPAAGSPRKVPGGAKLEPLAPADVGSDSILRLIGNDGSSLIECIDRMHHYLQPAVPQSELPCAWMVAVNRCKPKGGATCTKCLHGGKPNPDVIAAAKGGMRADLVAHITKTSPTSVLLK